MFEYKAYFIDGSSLMIWAGDYIAAYDKAQALGSVANVVLCVHGE